MNEETYAKVIDEVGRLYIERNQSKMSLLNGLISDIKDNSYRNSTQNKAESYNVNVFGFFEPNETTHSRLLAFFLDPNGTHGQGNLFLVEFLKLLEIAEPENGRWIVTAEKGRIDVLLKRKHPHAVIIIENKSNFAVDQENQLYRYWYQEIYRQQKEHSISTCIIENPPATHYRIIYLAPAFWKRPDEQSLRRPTALDKQYGLPETVPMAVEHRLFGELVILWLVNSLDKLPESNHRLKEFTKQYIEFWQPA